ncbi:hypothetical protein GIB67_009537 [Kingdonia uniflora]|uniref:Uncharacterized protein n=1 Tax=Kingdonia uniflora TaxID=39325 RepID=A0A7J7NW37_9MAGN|nr:hypothetical protein GIB67_009537 [Kingdonia uniflora]
MQYWFYEYCGVGHPIVKEDFKFTAYPHLRAWERENKKKTNGQEGNLFMLGRYHIDHRTIETITWEPWLDYAVSEINDVLITKLLSRKRMSLQVPNGNCEFYLRDRCWRQLTGEARILLDPPLKAGHLLTDSQRMGNINLFGPTALRASITPMVVTSTSVHSLSQDFSLPGEVEEPNPGWYIEWTGRREMFPITRLRDPPPMSSSYGTEELWHLTHGMRRLALAESARDAQRLQELADGVVTLRSHLATVDDQLYAHNLHSRMERDVWVVLQPAGGGARTRQR